MNKAPEKIYLNNWIDKWYVDKRKEGDTAYIRSDIVDGMREVCEAVVEAHWDEDEYAGNKVCDCAMCTAYRMARAALEEMKDEKP